MNYDTPTSYIQLGWPVVPLHTPQHGGCSCQQPDCDHIGKHPRVRDWQRCASTEHDMIMRWWGTWPRANIGIATGQRSGLLVLDVDEISEATPGHMPATPTVATAKGFHYYFAHPGIELPNAVRFLPGMDIRADNGLVVAPPSLHVSGQRYRWIVPPDGMPLAPCPQWLIDAVQAKMQEKAEAARSSGFAAPIPGPAQGGQPYAVKALHDELDKIRSTSNGTRNSQLNKSAFAIGMLLDAGQLDADDVYTMLVDAGMAAGLPVAEARTTARSGLRAGMQKPREIAPPRRPGGDDEPPSPPAPPATGPGRFVPALPDDAHNTDLGNAMRFVAQHGTQLRYVPKWSTWLLWDGIRWIKDETRTVYRLARTTVRSMYSEAGQIEDEKERKERARWALSSENKSRFEAMLTMAEAEEGIPVTPDALDADHYLLNCTNGTLDLRTGELRPHQPTDLITKRIDVAYHPDAPCPIWESFLARIMADDQELISYIQRGVGYTLTGSTQEQCLFFAYGTGRNGKSTFFETLLALMGEYGQKAPTEMIMARAPNTASNDVARLSGARLVVTAEIEEGRRLSESLVKDLTGGDTIVARFLYQELFEFKPSHKLWIYGNHRPEIRNTDPGIWRRIRVIPFEVQIPENEVDPLLKLKLLDELPGILAWAVRGCLDHQAHGLPIPAAVKKATEAYKSEMDTIAAFLADACVIAPHASVKAKDLYRAYVEWCEDNGERPLKQRRLGQQLNERGFDTARTGAKGDWYRFGIGLRADDPEDTDPTDLTDLISEKSPCRKNEVKSHENTEIGSVRSVNDGCPPLGREIKTGFTAVRLPAEQWQAARAAWRKSDMRALYAIARNCRVPYQALLDALGGNEE